MGKPGPISTLICLVAAAFTLIVSLVCLPATELLPAQVYPAKRGSGESLVQTLPGAAEAMKLYANLGVQLLAIIPAQPAPANDKTIVKDWQSKLENVHGDKYASELKTNIEQGLGGDDNLKKVLDILHVDKNFFYSAYALFLALALFSGAVAIQAMGRWGAEEKTILPVKK